MITNNYNTLSLPLLNDTDIFLLEKGTIIGTGQSIVSKCCYSVEDAGDGICAGMTSVHLKATSLDPPWVGNICCKPQACSRLREMLFSTVEPRHLLVILPGLMYLNTLPPAPPPPPLTLCARA